MDKYKHVSNGTYHMIEAPAEKISYGVICEKNRECTCWTSTYEGAVDWAKNNQPANKPYYIVERTEHFEICGMVN